MSRAKVSGRFKPLDTLSRGSAHAGNGTGTYYRPRNAVEQAGLDKDYPRFTNGRAATNNSGGSHRGFGAGVSGDGFMKGRERGQPATKKRKTQPELENPDDRIELSDDDEPTQVRVTSVNGKAVKQKNQAARTQGMLGKSTTGRFETNEFRAVDDRLRTDQQKTRRKSANGNRSSQASSSRASPTAATNGYSHHDVVNLVDDDSTQELTQTQAEFKNRFSGASQELPDPKAIGDNLDNYPLRRSGQQRQSGDSVEYISTNLTGSMAPPRTARSHANPEQEQAQQRVRRLIRQEGDGAEPPVEQRPRRSIPQGNDSGVTQKYLLDKQRRRSSEQEDNSRLNETFIRDSPAPTQVANGTTNRRSRMKARSGQADGVKVKPVGESSDEDELNGPPTVGSVSPEKRRNQVADDGVAVNGARERKSSSPSDLPSTQFTKGRTVQNERASGYGRKRKRQQDEYDERREIPLANFYATSCVLTEGSITLRYDEGDKQLDVYLNGDIQVVPGQQSTVHIGRTEASTVVFHKDSSFIYIKGSSDIVGVSNGSVCLTLYDRGDISWLSNHLCEVTGNRISWKTVESAEQMHKTFVTQAKALFTAWEKRKAKDAENEKAVRLQQRSRRFTNEDEQIKYESHEPAKPSRRKGMRGEDIVDQQPQSTQRRSLEYSSRSPYFQTNNTRRSTRQSNPVKRLSPSPPSALPRWTQIHKPARWPHSVVYPSTGARRVTVDFQDLERLDEGEFLNDNVISFALRQIEENMPIEQKDRMHFFNSFFYTALTTKNGKKAFNYDAVKRWTKSKDLLACDYVVVPINIDLHWFVAIICNLPNLPRRVAGLEEEEEEQGEDGAGVKKEDGLTSSDPIQPEGAESGRNSTRNTPDNSKQMRNLSISDDETTSKTLQPGEEDGAANAPPAQKEASAESPRTDKKAASATGRTSKKRGPPSYDPDKPAIIVLDSFGIPHTAEVRYLKQYVSAEAESKRSISVAPTDIQGVNAKGIPAQSNFCDCGAYLVGYVEQFARDPRGFVTKVLERKLDEKEDFKDFDASRKREQIRDELLRLQEVQEKEHKAKKAEKKSATAKTEGRANAPAAATPKPESKPVSTAASPAKDPVETAMASATEDLQSKTKTSRASADAATTPAQAHGEGSQDNDLEFSVPRALGMDSRRAGAEAAPLHSADAEEEDEGDEMLDDPHAHPDHAYHVQDEEPNPLLDHLAQEVRSSQRTQMQERPHDSLLDGITDAAAEAPPEEEGIRQPRHRGMRRTPGPQDEVIDLGDEEDEVSAEIPDSQEQSAPKGQWRGIRTTFD